MFENQQPVSGWQLFALQNNLTFKPDSFLLMREPYVTGNYCGYNLRLESFSRKIQREISIRPWWLGESSDSLQVFTKMTLRAGKKRAIQANTDKLVLTRQFDPKKVIELLMPTEAQPGVKGRFFAFEKGREIVYEQQEIEYDPEYLQLVLGLLKNLIEIYPRIVQLGGEVVPILHPIAKKYHVIQHITGQLIADIGEETKKRLKKDTDRFLCPHCLVHCGSHRVNVPWTGDVAYYGCRHCGQSRNLVRSEPYRLVVILDRGLAAEQVNHKETIRINWLRYRQLFDFEQVEIVDATDEDVERFAVQVGNDTDPFRRARYKKMRCLIATDCGVTENAVRILQGMFGEVELMEAGYWQP